jgi:hypothetical protein
MPLDSEISEIVLNWICASAGEIRNAIKILTRKFLEK